MAAAAAMRRSHRHGRRDGHRSRSGSHSRPQIMVFSRNEAIPGGSLHASSGQDEDHEQSSDFGSAHPFAALAAVDQGHMSGGSQLHVGHSDQGASNPSLHDERAMSRYFLQLTVYICMLFLSKFKRFTLFVS